MPDVGRTELRTRFAAALSTLYAGEVPAYGTLVEVSQEVNRRALRARGAAAERLGSLERVTAERHGAIRVGSPKELEQVARIFGALGMQPVGFYDLRDAQPRPSPVVSTAFRPIGPEELAINPFRVFTSMLVPQDRRFFGNDLERRLEAFLAARALFPAELLELADAAERHDGLDEPAATRFLQLASAAFALSAEPVDRGWYQELERISGVAADIGGVTSTHINHLTPRVLDIDDLYRAMTERGITMIDRIQGPPRWDGPDVLLRQTSFRALAEPRVFREPDGSLAEGDLRVRFGEVESRGIALTPAGRDRYQHALARIDAERAPDTPADEGSGLARRIWAEEMPGSEAELESRGLGYFTHHPAPNPPAGEPAGDLRALIEHGWVVPEPIVYEDFLPRSAAGIFASNLSDDGTGPGPEDGGAHRDLAWLSDRIGRQIQVPEELYERQSARSIDDLAEDLGRPVADGVPSK